jgi:RNA polymerase sigma-70 factor (ECF subfamily)
MRVESANSAATQARDFRTTHWSVVLKAAGESEEQSSALERLCRTYWYPLYSFIRRRGHNAHEAQDLTQGFFERFLEKNYLADVSADKGRFRTFLLSSLQHFLANEWDRSQAQKRGGGYKLVSLDETEADERFQFEPRDEVTPELAFERQWVHALIETALSRLRSECNDAGHEGRFEQFKVFLVEDKGAVSFSEMAAQLGMTEAAVKGIVRRMRQRYRELFREEIANTVGDPAEVDAEIRHLVTILGG